MDSPCSRLVVRVNTDGRHYVKLPDIRDVGCFQINLTSSRSRIAHIWGLNIAAIVVHLDNIQQTVFFGCFCFIQGFHDYITVCLRTWVPLSDASVPQRFWLCLFVSNIWERVFSSRLWMHLESIAQQHTCRHLVSPAEDTLSNSSAESSKAPVSFEDNRASWVMSFSQCLLIVNQWCQCTKLR